MNETDQLFIRACKSMHPRTRLKSVYRRRYYCSGEIDYSHLITILARLCEEYLTISLVKILDELSDKDEWLYGKRSYQDKVLDFLISSLRLTEVKLFPGLSTPRSFKDIS